jgi:hypothetical protein
VADQTCFALLVQYKEEKKIGLMILKTYMWRKPEDEDFTAPKIQLITKDLFLSYAVQPNRIIEAVSLKDKTILVQYRDTDNQVQLLVVYFKEKIEVLRPLDSNQNFASLKMVVAKDKAFIMAVDEHKKQTFYVLYHDY